MEAQIEQANSPSRRGGILSHFPPSARAIAIVAALVAGCSPPPSGPTRIGSNRETPVATSPQGGASVAVFDGQLGLTLPNAALPSQAGGAHTSNELRALLPQTARDLAHLVFELSHASRYGDLRTWTDDHPKEAAQLLSNIDAMRRSLTDAAQNEQAEYRSDARTLFESLGQVSFLIRNGRRIGIARVYYNNSQTTTDNSNDLVIMKAVADLEWYAYCLRGK